MRRRSFLAVLALLAASVALEGCTDPGESPGVVAPPIFDQGTTVTPAPSAQDAGSARATPSAAPSEDAPVTLASLSVPNYCLCLGPRNQAQIKVKVGVTNNTTRPISIAADRFRLAVTNSFAVPWDPKEALGTISTFQGASLIPANADGASEPFDGSNTFATHWSATDLSAGETYLDPAIKRGDLVFYVPLGPNQSIAISGVVLLNASDDPIGYAPFTAFTTNSDPNQF